MLWVLKQPEVPLCPLGFLRVHRSFLVNMLYILKLQSQKVVLKDGTALKVSERNYSGAEDAVPNLETQAGAIHLTGIAINGEKSG